MASGQVCTTACANTPLSRFFSARHSGLISYLSPESSISGGTLYAAHSGRIDAHSQSTTPVTCPGLLFDTRILFEWKSGWDSAGRHAILGSGKRAYIFGMISAASVRASSRNAGSVVLRSSEGCLSPRHASNSCCPFGLSSHCTSLKAKARCRAAGSFAGHGPASGRGWCRCKERMGSTSGPRIQLEEKGGGDGWRLPNPSNGRDIILPSTFPRDWHTSSYHACVGGPFQ